MQASDSSSMVKASKLATGGGGRSTLAPPARPPWRKNQSLVTLRRFARLSCVRPSGMLPKNKSCTRYVISHGQNRNKARGVCFYLVSVCTCFLDSNRTRVPFFGFYPQRVNESLSGLERGRVWKICVDYDIAQIPEPGSKVFSRKNTAGYSCARSISGLCTADTASTGSVLRVIPDSQDFGVRYCGYTLYFF